MFFRSMIVIGARLDRIRNIYGVNALRGSLLLCISTVVTGAIYLVLRPCVEMFVKLSCLRHANNERSIADACISQGSTLSNNVGALGELIVAGSIITALCTIGRYACSWYTANPYRLLNVYAAAKKRWNLAICIGYFGTTVVSFVAMGAAMFL